MPLFSWPLPLVAWWHGLLLLSAANIAAWACLARFARVPGRYAALLRAMAVLSGMYVLGCAFRSIWPQADIPPYSLFNTWLSSVAVGRSVATVAELAFAAQWSLALTLFSRALGDRLAGRAAAVVVPGIALAELCSWYAVITQNPLGFVAELSFWCAVFALVALALWRLMGRAHGPLRRGLGILSEGLFLYVLFLAAIDLPFYVAQWHNPATHPLTLAQGLRSIATPGIVTHALGNWLGVIPWMSLYFSLGVWSSLGLLAMAGLAAKDAEAV